MSPWHSPLTDRGGTPWRIGLSICYDLRFPELFRQLGAMQPLDLIVLPAAFTDITGKAHWELLLRAPRRRKPLSRARARSGRSS
jgi:predicted amidohydrolase